MNNKDINGNAGLDGLFEDILAVPRRRFLQSAAGLGAAALLPGCEALPKNAAGATLHRIDIHHHLLPPKYVAELPKLMKGESPPTNWTPGRSLETSMLSRSSTISTISSTTRPMEWIESENTSNGCVAPPLLMRTSSLMLISGMS